jgi:chemotaxis signal transduction protein
MSIENNKNKVDLLGFQKSLNEQFLQIFESKKQGNTLASMGATSSLGLLDHVEGLNVFLPLKELKNISMNNSYEEIKLSKSWVCGFNQIRGEVFTIMDLNKVLQLFTTKFTDTQSRKMGGDNRIVYLKDYNDSRIGLIINGLKLEYNAEYTPIIRIKDKGDSFSWEMEEGIEFESFVRKDYMSEKEFAMLSKIHNFVKTQKVFMKESVD